MRWTLLAAAGLLGALPLLAACGEQLSESEQQAQDRAMVERVREANDAAPPLVEVVPDPILYPDLEAQDLFGLQCAYAPGTSLGARVIARETDAWVKLNGEMIRLAADQGSRELPAGTRSLYTGRDFSLRLDVEDKGDGEAEGEGANAATLLEGTVWLRDRWDRVIYQGTGAVNCGA
ncbi:MAG: hypothetical protein KDE15_04850 [Erythrobacter sp.]|nr:hypothetical protein [Erythrobacter sp.]